MLFNSMEYALFFALVVALFWSLAPSGVLRQLRRVGRYDTRLVVLLIASYAFYAFFSVWFTGLLLATTAVHFTVGRQLGRSHNREHRKLLLAVGVLFSLALLGFFKYFDFFVSSVASLLHSLGLSMDPTLLNLATVWGISFYTFHTLSYTIDVYRRDIEPTDDLLSFAVFVAYFPQLLAGPLTRGRRMLPQFANLPPNLDRKKRQEGLELILLGLFQKVAIADALAPITTTAFVDTSKGPVPGRNSLMLLLAAFAGAAQFVLDFMGYSNLARGSSKLLGIELPYNFREPLTRSRDLQDYWRRHNMTVMAWFRDYVFRPLRRHASSRARAGALVVLVFLLSGLWHGATWGWVAWGAFTGIAVEIEIEVRRARDRARRRKRRGSTPTARGLAQSGAATATPGEQARGGVVGGAVVQTATTVRPRAPAAVRPSRNRVLRILGPLYASTVLAMSIVLVRTPNAASALTYYAGIASFRWVPLDWDNVLLLAYVLAAIVISDGREHAMELAEGKPDPPRLPRLALWTAMIVLILVFSGTAASQPFVYFQF